LAAIADIGVLLLRTRSAGDCPQYFLQITLQLSIEPVFAMRSPFLTQEAWWRDRSRSASTRTADPFIKIAHVIGFLCEADVRWQCADTIKFSFGFRQLRPWMTTLS
jgi:hypothetical protein